MYCRNCGKEVDDKAVACIHCGVPPKLEKKFCGNCGVTTDPNQVLCTSCGVAITAKSEKSKVVAGIFAIILGAFGAQKFYLGYKQQGIILLFVWFAGLVLLGIPSFIVSVIGWVEGVIYLTKSDAEFQSTYVDEQRPWF